MSKVGTLRPDPTAIGQSPGLPLHGFMFVARAQRLRAVAEGHDLGSYLRFLAAMPGCEHRVGNSVPAPDVNAFLLGY